jgi:glycosyltransferase involved in cell wall biosynthesis
MKILQVHNYYAQSGGEDMVVAAERDHLQAAGHDVITYYVSNHDLQSHPNTRWPKRLLRALRLIWISMATVWNPVTYRHLRTLLRQERPDVVHCHNTFPRISPSIYWACANAGIPVVQTLHNYRLLCLNAYLFRFHRESTGSEAPDATYGAGEVCHLCAQRKWKWPGIRYRCYRNRRSGSAVVALMLGIHHLLGTWTRKIDRYIVLTEFQRQLFLQQGWPADRFVIKSNPISTPPQSVSARLSASAQACGDDPFALYVGRLAPEKGLLFLFDAWAELGPLPLANGCKPRLVVIGDGPLTNACRERIRQLNLDQCVTLLGKRGSYDVARYMSQARFTIFPSLWYETFGLVVAESARNGTPVMVSSPGAAAELVEDGKTGWIRPAGDQKVWIETIRWAFEHPEACARMGRAAAQRFQNAASPQQTTQHLLDIYAQILRA